MTNDRKSTYRAPAGGARNPDMESGKASWGKCFLGSDGNNEGRISQTKKTGGAVGVELGWSVGNTVFGQKRTT